MYNSGALKKNSFQIKTFHFGNLSALYPLKEYKSMTGIILRMHYEKQYFHHFCEFAHNM